MTLSRRADHLYTIRRQLVNIHTHLIMKRWFHGWLKCAIARRRLS
jgi:hypothetical protein